jgi:o-succinylbenzoate synthase
MKYRVLKYTPYSLKLKIPFSTAKNIITKRNGFIVEIKDENGLIGKGDTAPFPEFGTESFERTESFLSVFQDDIKIDENNFFNSIHSELKIIEKLPTLRHAIEQAIIDIYAQQKNQNIFALLGFNYSKIIDVNAAIGFLSIPEASAKASNLVANGFKTLKLKCGRGNFREDFEIISAIREKVGDNINIRIDINGKWNLRQALKNIYELEPFNLEYIEQPVNALDDFSILRNHSSIPLAADESIRSISEAQHFISANCVSILVLKPMMIGGLLPTIQIIQLAEKNGIDCVITSSFESVIGRANAVIAGAMTKNNFAHGLGTAEYFEKDLFDNIYPVKEAKIFLR